MPNYYYTDKKGHKGKVEAATKQAAKMKLAGQNVEFKEFITAAEYKKKSTKKRQLTTIVGDVKQRITEYGGRYLEIKNQSLQLRNEQKGKYVDQINTLREQTHKKGLEILGQVAQNIQDMDDDGVSEEQIQKVTDQKEDRKITEQVKSGLVAKAARGILGSGNKLETRMVQQALEKKALERERTQKVKCGSVTEYQKFISQFNQDTDTQVIIEADHHDIVSQWKNKLLIWWANLNGKKIVILQSDSAQAARDLKSLDVKQLKRGKIEKQKGESELFEVTRKRQATGNFMKDMEFAINDWLIDITPIKTADIVTFYQLLNVMINAGVPLMRSLQELINQTKNQHLRKILINLLYGVENGSTFSATLGEYPSIFDNAQRGVIRSGEASGSLGDTLKRLSLDMEKSAKMAAKIKGAMIYPIAVITILIGVGVVVMVLIVPKLTTLFGDVDQLPASTQALVATSDFFINHGLKLLLGIIALVAGVKYYGKTEQGSFVLDYIKLKIPVFGTLNQKVAIARFTHSLASLSASGVNLIQGLEINADAIGNEVFKREILYTIESVKKGITIHEDLESSKLFPPMVVNMIGIGEETAQLGGVAEKIAEYYDEEVENLIKNLSTLMEPIIIVVLGISVALLVSAIMQPIMQISERAVQ